MCFRRLSIISLVLGLVAACATPSGRRDPVSRGPATSLPAPVVKNVPKANPHVKLGKPYKIAGIWYVPKAEPGYNKTGIASWYGPKFHGKLTSNGEIFDMNRVTAAHPTMPLPSVARVTNLTNGRQVVLRVNDRGPFAHGRLIDLSRAAAEELGYRGEGLAKVRVEYLGQAGLKDAITGLGEPGSYANGYYATVTEDQLGEGQATFDTVRTRISSGPEIKLKTVVSSGKELSPDTLADARRAARDAEKRVVEKRVDRRHLVSSASVVPSRAPSPAADTSLTPVERAPALAPPPLSNDFPSVASGTPDINGWLVQAGAFGSYENAQKASSKLNDIADVRTSQLARRDGTFLYRVRLGPFRLKEAALVAAQKAAAAGFPGAQIISP